MREVSPLERALLMLEKHEKELALLKAELSALLPDEQRPVRDWIQDPLTGARRYLKRSGKSVRRP